MPTQTSGGGGADAFGASGTDGITELAFHMNIHTYIHKLYYSYVPYKCRNVQKDIISY